MKMHISPTSTHTHQLRDPLVDIDVIGYKVVCDVKNTMISIRVLRLSLVHFSFKEKKT